MHMRSRCRICNAPKFGSHPNFCVDCDQRDQRLKKRIAEMEADRRRRKRAFTNMAIYLLCVLGCFAIEMWVFGVPPAIAEIFGGK